MAANLKTLLADTEALKLPYRQINLLVETSRYTIVPFNLYEDEQMDILFHRNLTPKENELVLCNILSKSNTVILFGIDKLTHVLLTEAFPEARIFAAISPLTEYFTFKSRQGNNRKLYLNVRPGKTDVLAFERGKLLLLNTYETPTCDDRCYYALQVWRTTGCTDAHDDVSITGNEPEKKELANRLKEFLPRVFIAQPDAAFSNASSGHIEEIPFDIQALLLCE